MSYRTAVLLALPLCCMAVTLPVVQTRSGPVATGTIPLNNLDTGHQYSLLYSLSTLRGLRPDSRVTVEVRQGDSVLATKTLHAGDADFYTQFRVPSDGNAEVRVRNIATPGNYRLQVNAWPLSNVVRRGPNHRWQDAMTIPLGKAVFASGDDAPYIPLPGLRARTWWTIRCAPTGIVSTSVQSTPKLVFFQLELTERDQIPVNVSVYRVNDGKPSRSISKARTRSRCRTKCRRCPATNSRRAF